MFQFLDKVYANKVYMQTLFAYFFGIALVIPDGIAYSVNRKKSSAFYGMLIGTLFMGIIGAITNYFILLPFYSKIMPLEQIIQMSAAANTAIKDVKTLVLYG
ncbi:MAG: riboflavin transporter [Candidatus Petromonas sp.]|jgi:riboflavin transporter FmnP|nr:riboflavin transporter [Candidatus Petromonas sp.]